MLMKMISFTEFFQNAYYHCLHYIVSKRLHWFERVFWFFWVLLSMAGVLYIVRDSVSHFYSTKASLRLRTDYLDFKTPFPAIFFCEKQEIKGKIPEMFKELNYTFDRSSEANVEFFVRTATFIRPLTSSPLFPSCGTNAEACRFMDSYKNNLSAFGNYIRSTCEEIFSSCLYNGEEFDCCEDFLPVDTFEGRCYALNNFISLDNNLAKWKSFLSEKRISDVGNALRTGIIRNPAHYLKYTLEPKPDKNPANMSVELAHTNMYVWYIGNDYLPAKMYERDNQFDVFENKNTFLDVYLRVQEILPDNSVFDLEPERRNCKFWYENQQMETVKRYSISGCETDCLRRAQLLYCGCVVHLLPKQKGLKDKQCSMEGIECTSKRSEIVNYLSFNCNCVTTCAFLEVYAIGTVSPMTSEKKYRDPRSMKQINFLVRAPTVQYRLYAVQEPLDFIVSIGGAISLFIGCSFLSLAQIFYYFLMKPLDDYIHVKKQTKLLEKNKNIQQKLLKQKYKLKIGNLENKIRQQVRTEIATIGQI